LNAYYIYHFFLLFLFLYKYRLTYWFLRIILLYKIYIDILVTKMTGWVTYSSGRDSETKLLLTQLWNPLQHDFLIWLIKVDSYSSHGCADYLFITLYFIFLHLSMLPPLKYYKSKKFIESYDITWWLYYA